MQGDKTMKKRRIAIFTAFLICLLLVFPMSGSAQDYEALKGIQSVKTIFDFRDGIPANALVHIQLIHETYKDDALKKITDQPEFVVVFMDSAVRLLSKNREGFSPEEKTVLTEMDNVISAMAKDGIKLEICAFAANFFGVDLNSISTEIKHVGNGWISSLGYQQQGYSLVPVF
jgi:intracellular sulfur oxidation DsrE/DsrF family protein